MLADQGVLFREAFCAAPTCSGSRASLLTGLYCHNNGMLGLAHRGWALNDYGQHWVHALRRGRLPLDPDRRAAHLRRPRRDRLRRGRPGRLQPRRGRGAADDRGAARGARRQPWFMSVGFFETHRDFFAPTSVRDTLYSLPPANLPDVVATRQDMAAFKASARSLDQGIGAVLHALHDFGLVENTLVICTTDHGVAFPGAKATLFDRGIGVMMIMRGPGGFTGGKVDRRAGQPPRRLPDPLRAGRGRGAGLAAGRLADAAGARRGRAPARGDLRRDHLPRRLRAAARGPHRALEVHPPLRRLPAPGARQLRRQRQQGPAGRGRLGRADGRPRSSSTTSCSTPPRATTSPPTRPAPRRWRRCAAGSSAWMRETDDPLLDGPVAPPPGAIVNEQWQVSPDEPPRIVTADPTAAAIQLRQVQPGTSVAAGVAALAVGEDAEPAVVRAEVPDPRPPSAASKSSPRTESSRKKRMKMPWPTSSGSSPPAPRLQLAPSAAAPAPTSSLEALARASARRRRRASPARARAPPPTAAAVSARPPHRAASAGG